MLKNSTMVAALFAVITSSPLAFGSSQDTSAADAQGRAAWQQIVADKDAISKLLQNKAHVITKLPTFEANGSINGSISGGFEANHALNLRGLVIGGLMGAAAAIPGGALASAIGIPTVFTQLLAAGSGAGATLGALTPSKAASGSISGSIDGKYSANGWENLKNASNFIFLVADPKQQQVLDQHISQASGCMRQVDTALKGIVDSGRYFSPDDLQKFAAAANRIQDNLSTLDSLTPLMSPELATLTAGFMKRVSKWVDSKHFIVVSFKLENVIVQKMTAVTYTLPSIRIYHSQNEMQETSLTSYWPDNGTTPTRTGWDSILQDWKHEALKQSFFSQAEGVIGSGTWSANLSSVYATDRGLFVRRLLQVIPVAAERASVTAYTLRTDAGLCETSTQAESLISSSTKSMDFFQNMMSFDQISQLSNQSVLTVNDSPMPLHSGNMQN